MDALVAEDNPVFRSMLKNLLSRWGYQVWVADDGQQAWAMLQKPDAPQLAILDWMMPGMDGVEVCRRLRATERKSYVYVLLLTARTDQKDLIEGMDAGADDYVTKPFSAQELRVRLRAGRRILELQQEIMIARDALQVQATHDALTGLWNRGAILDLLRKELARAERAYGSLAVLMTDIDHFKQINDGFGHVEGDTVLRDAASRMAGSIRQYDAIGRYGGEEFLVLLCGCDREGALTQAERLRGAVADEPFYLSGRAVPVTCSVGVAWSWGPGPTADSLLREADEALYLAKRNGRNRVELAGAVPEMAGVG